MVARSASFGQEKHTVEAALERSEEARRCRFGCFRRDVHPDVDEVGISGFGYSKDQRPGNNFLPRAATRSTSKPLSRPASRSARPF